MIRDFTVSIYQELICSLIDASFSFQVFRDFVNQPKNKVILLRHDVDARKEHSLQFAKIQHDMGIVGTYYFRMVPDSFNKEVILDIASMGHEIGYHYEDMDFAKGDVDEAYEQAKKHLAQLREVAEIKTICMHGSPRSPYDNKEVWKKYDYRELGIIAEPYFDLNFSKVLYLTDTGRRWDGEGVSIRDKVPAKRGITDYKLQITDGDGEKGRLSEGENYSTSKPLSKEYSFHSTHDIIEACKSGKLPDQIMMNFHPQRWTDNPILWTQELVWQNVKNVVKAGVLRLRERETE